MKTDVVIIGAGPTGLMAACQLSRFGIDFIIVDQKPGPTIESRAIAVTARSLEIYQQMGLSAEVLEQGQSIDKFSLFMDGKEKATIAIGEAGGGLTDFPFLFSFEQSKNEILLHKILNKHGRKVWWNTTFIALEQNEKEVFVKLRNAGKTEEITIKAKYLIACDGAKSVVRHTLNCNFSGGTYENKFYVADVLLNWQFSHHRLIICPSNKAFCGFIPMYGNKSYRLIGTLPKKFYNKEQIKFDEIEKIVEETVKFPVEITKLNWFSIYKLHHRAVNNFQAGKCFLAGDAAHIHSPAGGQGMNTGLQDAYNLSWKLGMVLNGFANEKLLETYHPERYPFARWLLTFTDRLFGFMTSSNYFISFVRKYFAAVFLKFIFENKWMRRRNFRLLSQIWYSYNYSPLSVNHSKQSIKFRAGDRLPYLQVVNNNKHESIYLLLTESKFHLLVIGQSNLLPLQSKALSRHEKIIKVVYLPMEENWKKLGLRKELFILVRPDNYIGLISDNINEGLLKAYFKKAHFI